MCDNLLESYKGSKKCQTVEAHICSRDGFLTGVQTLTMMFLRFLSANMSSGYL